MSRPPVLDQQRKEITELIKDMRVIGTSDGDIYTELVKRYPDEKFQKESHRKIKEILKDAGICKPAEPKNVRTRKLHVNIRISASDLAALLVAASRAGEPGNLSSGVREAARLVNPTPAVLAGIDTMKGYGNEELVRLGAAKDYGN